MTFDLQAAEKYLWTWLDIFRLGPSHFAVLQQEEPDRYLTPAAFFFGTLIFYGAIVTVEFGTLNTAHVGSLIHVKAYFGNDATAYIGRHIVYILSLVFWSALSQRLMIWWPLRQSVNLRTILKSNFYGSAIYLVIVTIDLLTLSLWVLVLPHLATDGPKVVFWQSSIELVLLMAFSGFFNLWMLSGFSRIRMRWLIEGQLEFTVTCTALGAAIGGFVGGLIGGIRGGLQSVANPRWYNYAFSAAFSLILAASIIGGLLWIFFFLLKKRLTWLRTKIQNEQVTYWDRKIATYSRQN